MTGQALTHAQKVRQGARDTGGKYAEMARPEADFDTPAPTLETTNQAPVWHNSHTWDDAFTTQVNERAAQIHQDWRVRRMDPDTGACTPLVEAELVEDTGENLRVDAANSPFNQLTSYRAGTLRHKAAAQLLDSDPTMAWEGPWEPDHSVEVTDEMRSMADLVAAFEAEGGTITVDDTDEYLGRTVRWRIGDAPFHPAGGIAVVQTNRGYASFYRGLDRVYTSDHHSQELHFSEDPDQPAFELKKSTSAFSQYREHRWGDRTLIGRSHGQPAALVDGEVAYWTDRPATDGPSRIDWQGHVDYDGEPGVWRLQADAVERVPHPDGTHTFQLIGAVDDEGRHSRWDELTDGWMTNASHEADARLAAVWQQARNRRIGYIHAHKNPSSKEPF